MTALQYFWTFYAEFVMGQSMRQAKYFCEMLMCSGQKNQFLQYLRENFTQIMFGVQRKNAFFWGNATTLKQPRRAEEKSSQNCLTDSCQKKSLHKICCGKNLYFPHCPQIIFFSRKKYCSALPMMQAGIDVQMNMISLLSKESLRRIAACRHGVNVLPR